MKIGVSFHDTFPPTPAYIGRILQISDGTKRDIRSISDLTGIPQGESTGKAKPHLVYAMLMGFLEEDQSTLTRLGALVRSEDSNCSEELTQWIMHSHLTSANGAEMWHYLYRELASRNNGVMSDEYYSVQLQNKFGAKVNTRVVKSCYINGLTAIDYLEDKDGISIRKQHVQREFLYLYAYELLKEWDIVFPGKKEITSEEMNQMHCDMCFGLGSSEWFSVLEMLASKAIIRLNRQLVPFTIIRTANTSDIIPKLYSLLI